MNELQEAAPLAPLVVDLDDDPPDRDWTPAMGAVATFTGPEGELGIVCERRT